MEIADNKPILKQVSDYCRRQILYGTWLPGEFITSTKELALRLGVNPRTVMKAYDELAAANIISNKRGQGYIVVADGPEQLHALLIREFEDDIVPELYHQMRLCGITPDDLRHMLLKLNDNGPDSLPAD